MGVWQLKHPYPTASRHIEPHMHAHHAIFSAVFFFFENGILSDLAKLGLFLATQANVFAKFSNKTSSFFFLRGTRPPQYQIYLDPFSHSVKPLLNSVVVFLVSACGAS
jgi:hypothetical protein